MNERISMIYFSTRGGIFHGGRWSLSQNTEYEQHSSPPEALNQKLAVMDPLARCTFNIIKKSSFLPVVYAVKRFGS